MVSAKFIASAGVFASAALAAPTQSEIRSSPNPLSARQDSIPPSQCATNGGSVSNYWGVYMNNNMMPSAQGTGAWAGGFLDNLRGRCGWITNWQAIPDNHGGIACTFNTSKFCQGSDVSAALDAASGEWVMCTGDTMDGLFDSAGNIIEGFADYLSAVAPMIEQFA